MEMEKAGIAVDVPYLSELSHEITTRLQQVESELNEVAGREINPNSARQLAPLLFEELGLPSGTAHQDRLFRRFRSAGEHPRPAPDRRADPGAPDAGEAEVDLRRCPAAAGQLAHRARAHLVQPDGRRDRSPLVDQSQSAEHPDPHRAGAARAARLRRRPRGRSSGCSTTRCWSPPTIRRSSCGCWRT